MQRWESILFTCTVDHVKPTEELSDSSVINELLLCDLTGRGGDRLITAPPSANHRTPFRTAPPPPMPRPSRSFRFVRKMYEARKLKHCNAMFKVLAIYSDNLDLTAAKISV